MIQGVLQLTTFYRSGTHGSDVYKWDMFVMSWRFHNRAWQPQHHDRPPDTSGTLWIHQGALTNQRCSLTTGYGIKSVNTNFIQKSFLLNIVNQQKRVITQAWTQDIKIQPIKWVCGIHGYFMSMELFKVKVSQNVKHFQWMHLRRHPVIPASV